MQSGAAFGIALPHLCACLQQRSDRLQQQNDALGLPTISLKQCMMYIHSTGRCGVMKRS